MSEPSISQDEWSAEVWEEESPVTDRMAHVVDAAANSPAEVVVGWRTEHDSLGAINVPSDRYWGAQTQRSLEHFPIGTELMPRELIHAYGLVKQAAAFANAQLGVLSPDVAAAIAEASGEVARGMLDDQFPLSVFQTGSGTHTHSNVNEVIANRAAEFLGGSPGACSPIHPQDHVNAGQSTNDTFVTAMHVAAVQALRDLTLPALAHLSAELSEKAQEWRDVPKAGRTHLMDAATLTVGQEWSGYVAAMEAARRHLLVTLDDLYDVALGGTAVGTGLNAAEGYRESAVAELARLTGHAFRPALDPFSAQSTVDALVRSHAALKGVAVTLFKIANDIRWMGSGPHHGLQELIIPENEAGSSMMPGKVNPTQAEATLMACVQVIGQDAVVSMAGAEGNFELNAFRPIVISNFLRSARILADAMRCMSRFLIHDLVLGPAIGGSTPHDSVTIVTALARRVGYEQAARIAHRASAAGTDVWEEALREGVDASVLQATRGDLGQAS